MKKRLLIVGTCVLILSLIGTSVALAIGSESHDVGYSLRVVGEPQPTPTPTPTPTDDVFTVSPSFLALGDAEPGDTLVRTVTVIKTGPAAAYTIHTVKESPSWGAVTVSPSAFLLTSTRTVTITIYISATATPGEYSSNSLVTFYKN